MAKRVRKTASQSRTRKTTRKAPRIAVLVEELYEDLELWYPVMRLREAGAQATIVGTKKGAVYTSKHGYPAKAEAGMSTARASQFDGVIVPGGYAPDKMRRHKAMVKLVSDIDKKGGLVASICHGPWVLAEADVVKGKKFTSVGAIKTDIINAGGKFRDKEVVVDENLITSRTPPDLPAFMKAILAFLEMA